MVNMLAKVLIWVFCHFVDLKSSHQYNASESANPLTACPLPWPTFQISHDSISEPEEDCHDKCKKKCDGRGFYLDESVNQVVCYHRKTTSQMIDGIDDQSSKCTCGGKYEKHGEFENCFPEMTMSLNEGTNRLRVTNCKKFCNSVDVYWSNAVEDFPPYIIKCHREQVKSLPLKGKCDFTEPLEGEMFRCYCGLQQPHRRRKPIPQASTEIAEKKQKIEGFTRCARPRINLVFAAFQDIRVCDQVCHHRNCQGKVFRHENDLYCYTHDEVRAIMKTRNANPLVCECGIHTRVDDPTSFETCEDRAHSWTMNIIEQKTECELKCFGIKAFTFQHGDTTILIKCAFESETPARVAPLQGKCRNKLYRNKKKPERIERKCYCGLPDEKVEEYFVARNETEEVRDAASALCNFRSTVAPTNNTSDCNKTTSPKSKMSLKRPPLHSHSGKSRSLSEVIGSTSQTSVANAKSQSSHTSALGRTNKNKAESALNDDRTQSESHGSSRGKGIALVKDFADSASTETESESEKQEKAQSEPATSTSISGAKSSSDSSYKPSKDSVNSDASDSTEKNKCKKSKKYEIHTWLTDWAELSPDLPSTSKNPPKKHQLVIPSISSLQTQRHPTQDIASTSDNPHQKNGSDNPSTSNNPHRKTGTDVPSTSKNPYQKTGSDIPSASKNPHQKTGSDIPSTSNNPHQKTGSDIPSASNNQRQGPAREIPFASENPPENPPSKKTNRRRVGVRKSTTENTSACKKSKSKNKSEPKKANASDLPPGKSNSQKAPAADQSIVIEEPTTSEELLMRGRHGPRVMLPPGYKMHGKEYWTVDLTRGEPKRKNRPPKRGNGPPKIALKVINSSKNNPIIVHDTDSPTARRRNSILPEGAELIPVDDTENRPSRTKKRPHDSSGSNPSRKASIPSTGVISLDDDEEPPFSLQGKPTSNENVSAKKQQQGTRKSSPDNSPSKSGTQPSNKSTGNDNQCNSASSPSKQQKSSSPSSHNDIDKDWLTLAL